MAAMRHPHALLLCLALMGASGAAAAVHKCTDARGRVTYQDEPCAAAAATAAAREKPLDTSDAVNPRPRAAAPNAKPPPAAPAITRSLPAGDEAAYATAQGAWRGPVQLHFAQRGARPPDAHTIAPGVVELQPDGRVRGTVPNAGCRLAGLHRPVATAVGASVEVTLSGCRDARFNARYAGQLRVDGNVKQASLSLHAVTSGKPGGVSSARVDAVLRR
jgi:Domain of unknown function (DUF4124)